MMVIIKKKRKLTNGDVGSLNAKREVYIKEKVKSLGVRKVGTVAFFFSFEKTRRKQEKLFF